MNTEHELTFVYRILLKYCSRSIYSRTSNCLQDSVYWTLCIQFIWDIVVVRLFRYCFLYLIYWALCDELPLFSESIRQYFNLWWVKYVQSHFCFADDYWWWLKIWNDCKSTNKHSEHLNFSIAAFEYSPTTDYNHF